MDAIIISKNSIKTQEITFRCEFNFNFSFDFKLCILHIVVYILELVKSFKNHFKSEKY